MCGHAGHLIEVEKVMTRDLPVVVDVIKLHEWLQVALAVMADPVVRPTREFAQCQIAVKEELEPCLESGALSTALAKVSDPDLIEGSGDDRIGLVEGAAWRQASELSERGRVVAEDQQIRGRLDEARRAVWGAPPESNGVPEDYARNRCAACVLIGRCGEVPWDPDCWSAVEHDVDLSEQMEHFVGASAVCDRPIRSLANQRSSPVESSLQAFEVDRALARRERENARDIYNKLGLRVVHEVFERMSLEPPPQRVSRALALIAVPPKRRTGRDVVGPRRSRPAPLESTAERRVALVNVAMEGTFPLEQVECWAQEIDAFARGSELRLQVVPRRLESDRLRPLQAVAERSEALTVRKAIITHPPCLAPESHARNLRRTLSGPPPDYPNACEAPGDKSLDPASSRRMWPVSAGQGARRSGTHRSVRCARDRSKLPRGTAETHRSV